MQPSPFQILCATGLLAVFSSTISKSPVLPLFAGHLGAGPATVGLIAAISAFAGVIFSVPAGLLADRFGKKRLIMLSGAFFATAPFAYLLVRTPWQLALVRLYHGCATAIFIPVAMALVSELSDKERGEKLGWFSSATLAGRFMAPICGGSLLSMLAMRPLAGFSAVYLLCGAAGVSAFLLAALLPSSSAEKRCGEASTWQTTLARFSTVIRDRAIIITCAVEAAILFAYGTFETFLPLHAVQQGLGSVEIGIVLSAQIIVLALGKPIMGKLSDVHGREPQIVLGGVAGSLAIGLFSLATTFPLLLGCSILFGICLSVVTSATTASIADLSSSRARGSAMGMLGSIMDIGHSTGPLISGMIAGSFGFARSFIGAALVLLAVTLVYRSTIARRAPSEQPQ